LNAIRVYDALLKWRAGSREEVVRSCLSRLPGKDTSGSLFGGRSKLQGAAS
jgi:hypothetical protein